MKYDFLIFIGRFQPFHLGHKQVIKDALQKASNVVVLVGSAYQPRTMKNPLTFQERQNNILASLDPQDISRLVIRPLRDYAYNEQKWVAEVQQILNVLSGGNPDVKIGIIGYEKDNSSYYLNEFPQWDFVPVKYNDRIDASGIRDIWLSKASPMYAAGALTTEVHRFLFTDFVKNNKDEYERLCREYEHIRKYKKQWEAAPYAPTFVTTDAVVIQSGHVLLVQRGAQPGEGLWALPGGFLDQNETVDEGVIRELREETGLKVPAPVLLGSVKARRVFDHPGRSLRGRTITHAALIELPHGKLPKVKGSDDAAAARWIPLSQFEHMEEKMFEDHFHIVNYFLGRI